LIVIDIHELKIDVQLSIYIQKLGDEISLDIHGPNIDELSIYIYIDLKFVLTFMDRPIVGVPSLDIHGTTIDSGIDIKKPKIHIP